MKFTVTVQDLTTSTITVEADSPEAAEVLAVEGHMNEESRETANEIHVVSVAEAS